MKKALLNFLFIFYSVSIFAQIDTEFWFVAPEVSPDVYSYNIPIVFRISTIDRAADVVIDQPANPEFTPITVAIGANSTHSVDLSSLIDLVENKPANEILNKGIRILATEKVNIYYEVVSSYCNCNPEIFTLKGKNALGTYFFTPFQNILNNNGTSYDPVPYSAFDIVATEDNTTVNIVPTNDVVGHPAGVVYSVILNRGQTYSARASSQAAGLHLHGSVVQSDKAIAITIKDDLLDGSIYGGCADLAGDQLVPVNRTGMEYVVIKGFLAGPDRVFVLATEDNTQVTIAGNLSGTIQAGQTMVYDLMEPSVYIESTANIYVLQLSGFGCEVGCGLIPPVNCTGSMQIGFTRSVAEDFKLMLMVQSGGEGDFSLNGSTGFITAADFIEVPFSNGKWKATRIDLNTSQVPVDQACLISNSSTRFHLGIIHGSAWGGCRFGYFSDFAMIETQITANGTDFCEGETLALTAGEIPDVTYEWSGPGGFTAQGASIGISSLSPDNSGYYILNGSNGYCPAIPDSVLVTVHPLPANLGEPIAPVVDVLTGLVAFYPFNSNANDESGNGNHGVVNGATLTTDRFGNENSAFSFDGNQTNINIPSANPLDIQKDISISAWFVTTEYNLSGQQQIFWRGDAQGGYDPYSICFSMGYLQFRRDVSGSIFNALNYIGDSISFDVYHNVVGTYNDQSGIMSLFLDGIMVENEFLPGFPSYPTSAFWNMIGSVDYGGWQTFLGKIDDIRIYNRALTPEEVYCLYTGDCQSRVLTAEQGQTTLCRGGTSSITLFNAQQGVSYQVMESDLPAGQPQVGNADTLFFNLPEIHTDKAYTILATDTTTGCAITLDSTFVVEVKDVNAIAQADMPSGYIPATVEVSSQSVGAATYEWLLDGVKFTDSAESQIVIDSTGTHTLVLLVSSGPPDYCTDADTLYLTTTERIEVILEIPASFTPNADGINDYFEFLYEGIDNYNIWFKDPWGVLIYEYDQATGKWDGLTTTGKEAPAGPYYYHLTARDYSGMVLERSGAVYLIRDLIELSPNPAKDKLVIKMNGRLPGERSIHIVSANGAVVADQVLPCLNECQLDISRLKSGYYMLVISNGIESQRISFVKE